MVILNFMKKKINSFKKQTKSRIKVIRDILSVQRRKDKKKCSQPVPLLSSL